MNKYVLIGILLIAAVGAFFWWNQSDSSGSELPPLSTVEVDKGDVSRRVVAFGAIQPVQKVTVGSQVSGIIEEIFVDFNSMVSRGDVIARIESSTFEAEVSSARAELESAEAALELARMQWDRTNELRERQFVSPADVDQASATLRQAEAQVRVRRHALERAERELSRCTITAPTDGIIISRDVDVGQTVAASLNAPELFQIATDLSLMHIYANVSEADIGQVKDGQRVVFRVDAYRDRDFTGEVIQVRNAPLIADNVVHYETLIAVDNEEQLLKPGMTTEVNIITEEQHDVLRVRNTALRARLPDGVRPATPDHIEDGQPRVYVVRDGRLEVVAVETGLSDGVNTEIISGISEGDILAVGLSLTTGQTQERRSLFGGSQEQF